MRTILVAIGAHYVHINLAVYALKACCDGDVEVLEFNINQQPHWVLRELAARWPDVVVFSCYIWNIEFVHRVAADLKEILPGVRIVLGGPEVSYDAKDVVEQWPFVDVILCGEGEHSLPLVLERMAAGEDLHGIPGAVWSENGQAVGDDTCAIVEDWASIPPVDFSGVPGLRRRIAYYESSRGCPFSCGYCLSGSAKGVRFLPMDRVKEDLTKLVTLGVPLVKFVDRTFNANPRRASQLVRWILDNTGSTHFHFEVAADLLDDEMMDLLRTAPAGKLQVEAGVQSCYEPTLQTVSRVTDLEELGRRVKTLIQGGRVHVHLDLIAGLPLEDYTTFGQSFDQVFSLRPHALQLGFLKLLKGSRLRRDAQELGLVGRDYAPWEILHTRELSGWDLLHLKGIEEMCERYYNSGHALRSLEYLLKTVDKSAFGLFEKLEAFCSGRGTLTRPLSLTNQMEELLCFGREHLEGDCYRILRAKVAADCMANGGKGKVPGACEADEMPGPLGLRLRQLVEAGIITKEQHRLGQFAWLPADPEKEKGGLVLAMAWDGEKEILSGRRKVTILPSKEEG